MTSRSTGAHQLRRWVPLDIAATVAFVLGLIPVLGLAFPNILGLPRWNPWEHPAYWPGITKIALYPGMLRDPSVHAARNRRLSAVARCTLRSKYA